MNKHKIIFVGNRPLILREILLNKKFELIAVDYRGDDLGLDIPVNTRQLNNCKMLLEYSNHNDFDILISAGCPYLIPLKLMPTNKTYINSHPSALPFGRGLHPLNECFLSDHKKMGVTLHFMSDNIDCGDIINQIQFNLTNDIDLDLLHSFIFDLERENFIIGINKLIKSNFSITGIKQDLVLPAYKRNLNDLEGNIKFLKKNILLRKIKAVGTSNLGFKLNLSDSESIIIYSAEEIFNEFLLSRYKKNIQGVILRNENFLLIKLVDGIIKVNRWLN